jgi:hypothetical protein
MTNELTLKTMEMDICVVFCGRGKGRSLRHSTSSSLSRGVLGMETVRVASPKTKFN